MATGYYALKEPDHEWAWLGYDELDETPDWYSGEPLPALPPMVLEADREGPTKVSVFSSMPLPYAHNDLIAILGIADTHPITITVGKKTLTGYAIINVRPSIQKTTTAAEAVAAANAKVFRFHGQPSRMGPEYSQIVVSADIRAAIEKAKLPVEFCPLEDLFGP